jgi:hypothetical protein
MTTKDTSRMPTRKWLVTQTTAVAAVLVAWVNVGGWDKTISIAVIGLMSQAVASYLMPNEQVIGGVRPKPTSSTSSTSSTQSASPGRRLRSRRVGAAAR